MAEAATASAKQLWNQHPWLRKRLERSIARRARQLHKGAVAQWALEDDSPLPTLDEARLAAEHELHTLLRGLGQLAAIDSTQYFTEDPFDFTFDWD